MPDSALAVSYTHLDVYKRQNHNGLDKRARELITIKDGKFRLLGDTKVVL